MEKIKIREIPKIYGHDLSLTVEGVGPRNPKEYCNCKKCKELRKRRDEIYSGFCYRIKRWINKNI